MPNVYLTGGETVNKASLPSGVAPIIKDSLYQIPGVYFNTIDKTWSIPHYSLPFFLDAFEGDLFCTILSDDLCRKNFKNTTDYFNLLHEIKSGVPGRLDITSNLNIKGNLYPHQRICLEYLVSSNGVALVGDQMGLGKCVETISYCLWLKTNRNISKVLIICPNSIKTSVWAKEIQKWSDETFTVVEGTSYTKSRQIDNCNTFFLIANYEAVRELKTSSLLKNFQQWKPDMTVVDEAHAIKNRTSKQTKSIKKIKVPYRLLLTGTPILNKVDDIWSLLNFLKPELWNNYNMFCETYCIYQKRYFGGRGSRPVRVVTGYKNLEKLKKEIAPIFIQRFKKDVLKDLPEKIYEDRCIPLLPEQVARYNDLVRDFKTTIEGKEVKITQQLLIVQLLRLLQVCDTLACLGGQDTSSKLNEVESIVDDMVGHKIVVFTWFKETGVVLEKRLVNKGITVGRIDGDVAMDKRTKIIDDFQNTPDPRVFVATISSCGLGLTLTAADVCIFCSRSYVPGLNQQAEDRLHRPGQINVVNIINLYSENTVDDRVKEILEVKEGLFDAFVKEDLMREVKT